MSKCKHEFDENEWGYDVETGEKEFFCKKCQKKIVGVIKR